MSMRCIKENELLLPRHNKKMSHFPTVSCKKMSHFDLNIGGI